MQTYTPFGLRPAYHTSGIIRPGPLAQIESGYATNIYQGYPVVVATTGYLTAVAAGNDNLWNGVFSGVEYNTNVGALGRVYDNKWVASTVLPTSPDMRAYYTADDVGLVYSIQCNAALGVTYAQAIANIGEQFPITALAGNAITGLAEFGLAVASAVGAGDQSQLRLIGLQLGPDNDWLDPYPVVYVQNAAHPWVARVNVQA